jgi:4-hydroxy-3-methylbut-2-enyl diphosphate reductase
VADELGEDADVGFLTQTTLSIDDTAEVVDALRERFTRLRGPGSDDICYASQNRQAAVKALAARTDLVLVVGSPNSSNSLRMVEVARAAGTPGHLVPTPADLDPAWLEGVDAIGVSAGASTPEILVDRLVERLAGFGYTGLEIERTATEDVVFALPSGLGGKTRHDRSGT